MFEICNIKKNILQETAKQVSEYLKIKKEILFVISGGSALRVSDFIDRSVLSEKITIVVSDERFSEDKNINNFAQLQETKFFDHCLKAGCAFIGTQVQKGQTFSELTQHMENQINKWIKKNPGGQVVALLGLGEDGHTVGIMPHPENPKLFSDLFEQEDDFVVGYNASDKNKHPFRVTLTNTFLRKIDKTVVYFSGSKKQKAFELLKQENPISQMPGQIFKEMKDVKVFTDRI